MESLNCPFPYPLTEDCKNENKHTFLFKSGCEHYIYVCKCECMLMYINSIPKENALSCRSITRGPLPLILEITSKLIKTVENGKRLMFECKAQIIQSSNTDVESFLT